ncbi:hypothetical protein VAT7223_03254 [Vibrio atlanticus]|uniref:Uncharacterized protein n=1 Tax=Vibrio atlanticus TaxID=693153 RepID=A0A1C3IYS7_9VIBR|nr:hypothetical protein VAT7223_03254 [Vibrio atlanticus]
MLNLNGFSLEIVQADEKVGSCKCGTVLYWSVNNLDKALDHFEELGAKLYRGPMAIENGLFYVSNRRPVWQLNWLAWGDHVASGLNGL